MAEKESNNIGCGSIIIIVGVIAFFSLSWGWGTGLIVFGIVVAMAAPEAPQNTKSGKTPPPIPVSKKKNVRGRAAKWLGKDQVALVAGEEIGGFVYVGENLEPIYSDSQQDDEYYGMSFSYGSDYDAALIRPSAKVNYTNPDFEGRNLDYWPNYSTIPPRSRAAYLTWLVNGKSNEDVSIGYVFLYFYGIERRLFFDPNIDLSIQEPLELINELVRLYSIYAEKSRSFRNYCSNLICQAILAYYPENIDEIPDSVLDAFTFEISPIVKFKLAEFANQQIPVPDKWAYALIVSHPEISLKMPAKRCPSEFKKLFLQLYEDKYGNGIIIKECKRKLTIDYRPASSTLMSIANPAGIPKGYKDVAELRGTVNRFAGILEKCYELLNPYSRFLGRAPHLADTLEAVLLLPPQLISPDDDRIKDVRQKLINEDMKERGLRSIKLHLLCDTLGIPAKDNLSLKAIRDIKNSMSGLGFGFSPDYDYCGIKADKKNKVVIFQIDSSQPDLEREKYVVQRIILFLRLGMLIATADGHVSSDEIEYLTNMIDGNDLSNNSRTRLWAFLEFLLNNKVSNVALKKNVDKLSQAHKNLLANEMTAMVKADGEIDKNEITQLGKIFKMLGLDSKQALTHLHRTEAVTVEPVTVAQKTKHQDYQIPLPKEKQVSGKSVIDYEKVALKQKETEEVFTVLGEIFQDEDTIVEETGKSNLEGLNDLHQKLFDFLVTKSEWPRTEVEEFCKPMQLMVDGAMEVINDYAISKYEEPLLEGDDPIYVELELAQEMQDG